METKLTERTLKELVWAVQKARALKTKSKLVTVKSPHCDDTFIISLEEAKPLEYELTLQTTQLSGVEKALAEDWDEEESEVNTIIEPIKREDGDLYR